MLKLKVRIACFALLLGLGGWAYSHLTAIPLSFYKTSESQRRSLRTAEDRLVWQEKSRRLRDLWLLREKQDVTSTLLILVKDPDSNIRERAVRMVGRLENPRVLPVLQKKAADIKATSRRVTTSGKRPPTEAPDHVGLEVLQLAIGRIQARSLHGQEKVNALLRSCSYLDRTGRWQSVSWSQVVAFSKGANTTYSNYAERNNDPNRVEHVRFGSPAHRIFSEVLDVLHSERKQGRDISALERQLKLSKMQKAWIASASFPLEQEIQAIFDYGLEEEVFGPEESRLTWGYLSSLPPTTVKLGLHKKMVYVLKNPSKYHLFTKKKVGIVWATGLTPFWKIAPVVGDSKTVDLLQQFVDKYPSSYIEAGAQGAIDDLRKGEVVPLFPNG